MHQLATRHVNNVLSTTRCIVRSLACRAQKRVELPGRLLEATRKEQLDDTAGRAKHGETFRVDLLDRATVWQ